MTAVGKGAENIFWVVKTSLYSSEPKHRTMNVKCSVCIYGRKLVLETRFDTSLQSEVQQANNTIKSYAAVTRSLLWPIHEHCCYATLNKFCLTRSHRTQIRSARTSINRMFDNL